MDSITKLKLNDFPPAPSEQEALRIISKRGANNEISRPSHFWGQPVTFEMNGKEESLQQYAGRDLISDYFIGLVSEDRQFRAEVKILRQSNDIPSTKIALAKSINPSKVNAIGFDLQIVKSSGERMLSANGTKALAWGMFMAPKILRILERPTDNVDFVLLDWEAGGTNFQELQNGLNNGLNILEAIRNTWSFKRISDMFGFYSIEGIVFQPEEIQYQMAENYQVLLSRNPQTEQVPYIISPLRTPDQLTFIK